MIDETEHGVLITLVTQTLINVYTKTSQSFKVLIQLSQYAASNPTWVTMSIVQIKFAYA